MALTPREERIRAHEERVAALGLDHDDVGLDVPIEPTCECGAPAERGPSKNPLASRHSKLRSTLKWCKPCREEQARHASRECQRRRRSG